MTYKTYAVTTVVTDNELAKHLSWSSHLKRNYQKKQNVLQAPETWTEPNCTKYCETSILAPSAKYPAYIYIYALEKIILTVPGKNKTHRISIARQPQEEKQIESWGGRHVGKVLGQPKKRETESGRETKQEARLRRCEVEVGWVNWMLTYVRLAHVRLWGLLWFVRSLTRCPTSASRRCNCRKGTNQFAMLLVVC